MYFMKVHKLGNMKIILFPYGLVGVGHWSPNGGPRSGFGPDKLGNMKIILFPYGLVGVGHWSPNGGPRSGSGPPPNFLRTARLNSQTIFFTHF
jgi:hypothetical protein